QPGLSQGQADFIVKITNPKPDKTCQLETQSLDTPNPPDVKVELNPIEISTNPKARTWDVKVKVLSMPVVASGIQRHFIAKYCGDSEILTYTLDNSFAGQFGWTVAGPVPQRWDGSSPLPLSVWVGPTPATNVRIAGQQLKGTDFHTVDASFILCETRNRSCETGPVKELAANTRRDLWLWRIEKDAPPAGELTGSFRLVADQKPEGDAFDLALHVSSCWLRIIGAFVLLVGVLLS